VVFDGKTLADIHNLQITKSISTVDQEISLFRGNVRDNLTLWDSKIDDADIKRACDDAVILEVVQGMPGGLDAELIEGGTNLSGGQRQRLEIARSLVRDPTIILFDEATSALDAETERLVMDKIRNRGCTAIIVAHRLSTIRDCDEIIVMDKGKIKERGTHSELWNANGHYRQLMMADQ
jgi:ATP-binding cassette subfamily C protein